jgi:hypothetical protein
MNQCCALFSRRNHEIKGPSKHKFFVQRICAMSNGYSIPLSYPKVVVFRSIFWKDIDNRGSIPGAIPAPLLSEAAITNYQFESIPGCTDGWLMSPSASTTSTDSKFIAFQYDILVVNLACTHLDSRMVSSQ